MIQLWVLRNNKTGKFYRHRNFWGYDWVDSIQKAKKFKRRGDVSNAVSLRKEYGKGDDFKDITYLVAEIKEEDFREE